MKKIDVLPVILEVEYKNPVLGRVFAFFARLMLIRFKKFNVTMNNKTVFSFYRLIVPRFVKGRSRPPRADLGHGQCGHGYKAGDSADYQRRGV